MVLSGTFPSPSAEMPTPPGACRSPRTTRQPSRCSDRSWRPGDWKNAPVLTYPQEMLGDLSVTNVDMTDVPYQMMYIIYIYGAALATPPPPPTNGYGWTVSSGSSGPPPCGLWWWYGSSGPPPVACGGGMVLLVPPLWPVVVVCWYVCYVCWYVCMYGM